MFLPLLVLLFLQVFCLASKVQLLRGTFDPLKDKYKLGFSPLVGHAIHEFLFQLSKLSTDTSFPLQDFLMMNFGRVPGSFSKNDFFVTKKPAMVASHFSMEDYVLLLHHCHRIREAVDKGDDITRSIEASKVEIVNYFENNVDYRESMKRSFEGNKIANQSLEEAKLILTSMKSIGARIDFEMKRIMKMLSVLYEKPISPEGLQIFLPSNERAVFSLKSKISSDWGVKIQQEIQKVFQSLQQWDDNSEAKELIVQNGQLNPKIRQFLDRKLRLLDRIISEVESMQFQNHNNKSECQIRLEEEQSKFLEDLIEKYRKSKNKSWVNGSLKSQLNFAPPLGLFYVDCWKFPNFHDFLSEWNDLVRRYLLYLSEALNPSPVWWESFFYKNPNLPIDSLHARSIRDAKSLIEIAQQFREIYQHAHSYRDELSHNYLNTLVCKNAKSFDECFQSTQENALTKYVDAMFSAVLGSPNQPLFAKYSGEAVLLSAIWSKFINSGDDVKKYFELVQKLEPDFAFLADSPSSLEQIIYSESDSISQFIQIPYRIVPFRNHTFPNCMEAVVRDFIRLLVESKTIDFGPLEEGLDWWTNALSDKPNISYVRVSSGKQCAGWIRSTKKNSSGTFKRNSRNFCILDDPKEYVYEMNPNILNLFVSVDLILAKGKFKDWDFMDENDGMKRGMELFNDLNLILSLSNDSVKINFGGKPISAGLKFHAGKHASMTVNFHDEILEKLDKSFCSANDPDIHALNFIQYCLETSGSRRSGSILPSEGSFSFFNYLAQILLECKIDVRFFELFQSYKSANLAPYLKYILGSIHEFEIAKLIMTQHLNEIPSSYKINFLQRIIQENPNEALFVFEALNDFSEIQKCFDNLNVHSSFWRVGKGKNQKFLAGNKLFYFKPHTIYSLNDATLRSYLHGYEKFFKYYKVTESFFLEDFPSSGIFRNDIQITPFWQMNFERARFDYQRQFFISLWKFYHSYPITMARYAVSHCEGRLFKEFFDSINVENFAVAFDFSFYSSSRMIADMELLNEAKVTQLGDLLAQKYPDSCVEEGPFLLSAFVAKRLAAGREWQKACTSLNISVRRSNLGISPLTERILAEVFQTIDEKIQAIDESTIPCLKNMIMLKYEGVVEIFLRLFPENISLFRALHDIMKNPSITMRDVDSFFRVHVPKARLT